MRCAESVSAVFAYGGERRAKSKMRGTRRAGIKEIVVVRLNLKEEMEAINN